MPRTYKAFRLSHDELAILKIADSGNTELVCTVSSPTKPVTLVASILALLMALCALVFSATLLIRQSGQAVSPPVPATVAVTRPVLPPALRQPEPVPDTPAPLRAAEPVPVPPDVIAANIRRAAERRIFTVPLSSGHARTLYVFADPQCAVCRRLEPALRRAAEMVNISIFPVSVYRGQTSLDLSASVLCVPEEERAERWRAVYTPSITPADNDTDCDLARRAVAVNDQAFRIYGFEGTPWIIDDQGQAMPQSVVSDPAQLAAWLGDRNPETETAPQPEMKPEVTRE